MNHLFISFIIPAYNAEPYLKECLDSIYRLDTRGRGFEVIVVNDGSTDGTADLLTTYQQRYADLQVVTQENKGQGAARNVGMRLARGKYLCFVDADDCLYAAQIPVEMMERWKADIFSVNILQIDFEGKRSPYRRYIPEYEVMMKARSFMQGRNLQPCVYGYFWRRDFLQERMIVFPEGIFHEDEEFVVRAFVGADTFVALNVDWYERILRRESTTTTVDVQKQQLHLRNMVTALQHLECLAQTSPELRSCMQYKLDYLAVDTLRVLLRQWHSRAFRREIIAALKQLGYFPLHWHNEWKYALFNFYTRLIL